MTVDLNLTSTAFVWVAAATCTGVLAAFLIRGVCRYAGRELAQLNSNTPTPRAREAFDGEETAGI